MSPQNRLLQDLGRKVSSYGGGGLLPLLPVALEHLAEAALQGLARQLALSSAQGLK